jgi:hypothetical protein
MESIRYANIFYLKVFMLSFLPLLADQIRMQNYSFFVLVNLILLNFTRSELLFCKGIDDNLSLAGYP